MRFKLNGSIYEKNLVDMPPSLNVGDTLTLRYLNGHEDYFLSPHENPIYPDMILIVMFLMLSFAALYQAKKLTSNQKSLLK